MELDVLGGEPFVQADTYRLIDEVSAVNSDCTWAFVSNGNYNFKPLRRRLEKLKIRWFMLSLDSVVPETYARIRKGGDLKRALDTIDGLAQLNDDLRAQGRDFDFSISMCVQKDNWHEIEKFFVYCNAVQIRPWLQFAYTPTSVSLLDLPHGQRQEILWYLESLESKYGSALVEAILAPVRDSLAEREVVHEQRL
jgi:cyclic pyranopterin phosphate synthase